MRILLLTLIIFQFTHSNAQQVVGIELDKEQFNTTLPFDIKFKIEGTLPSKKSDVSIRLEIVPESRKKLDYYFADGVENLKDEFKSGTDGTFRSSSVGPLRPNIRYLFKFNTLTRVPIDRDSERFSKFKQNINELLLNEIPKLTSRASIDNLNIKLNNRFLSFISSVTGKDISSEMVVSKIGEKVIIRSFGDLKADELFDANFVKDEANSLIDRALEDYRAKYEPLKDEAKALTTKLDSTSEFENLLRTILSSVDNFEKFVKQDFLGASDNKKFLKRFTEIFNNKLKDESASIQLVKENIITKLTNIQEQGLRIKESNDRINVWQSQFSDHFTEPFFVAEQFLVEGLAEIDVTSEKTPYISLDVGINSRFEPIFTGLTQFHLYQGANIYLRPVEKRAPLGTFKFPSVLFKMLSFNLGIAERLGAINNPDFKGSVGETTNFLVGTGLRINRIFKINFNLIFFKLDPKNPVTDRPRLKPYPFIALSIDANVAKALGPVGKALGLF